MLLKLGLIRSWNGRIGTVLARDTMRTHTFTHNDLTNPKASLQVGTNVEFQPEGFEAKVVRPRTSPSPRALDARWRFDAAEKTQRIAFSGRLVFSERDLRCL